MKIGIVGATKNKSKYGYKVLRNLINKGYTRLFPINPNYSEIEGIMCFKGLLDIPETLDLIIFVVPPSIGLKVLKDVVAKRVKNVWFQPGAESKEIEDFCNSNNLNYSFYNCIIIKDKADIERFIEK